MFSTANAQINCLPGYAPAKYFTSIHFQSGTVLHYCPYNGMSSRWCCAKIKEGQESDCEKCPKELKDPVLP